MGYRGTGAEGPGGESAEGAHAEARGARRVIYGDMEGATENGAGLAAGRPELRLRMTIDPTVLPDHCGGAAAGAGACRN